ncbi:unnamed protein product [Rotaria magnacalcarata]|uniref:G-protein coupled receptors family 1 profile domain-containing protein n=2 Tax=Rotaria magnacalcarata TaxID=392030 RepID=A0A816PIQ9_9BILA|nr:unnamed protein product [Rotaria magnacalcarata]CAF1341302.1 unnamed protein product [Rotaria magnacalcarata]CAF2049314.1 unnamed protein product [Rotaria magnacalcarata]CAF2072769.1 unnamed protein product [Rotaria magnacalcarata]CAF2104847.1 unnamed protein product [Rotaria magnacalcarata]
MSMFKEDVLWLEPLFFDSNFTMIEATFGYQMTSSSSNLSSSAISILTATATSAAGNLSNQNRAFFLKWLVRIVGGLLIIIGGIGNTLSALTLSRKKLRAQVTSIYLIALALSDLGNVFFSVLNFYLVRLDPHQNMRLYSNLSCKVHIFFTYYFINLSPTLLVAVSVQRYLAIAKHHYSKRHCTVKNAYMVIGLICLFSVIIQLHWGIFYELKLVPENSTTNLFNHTINFRSICNVSNEYPNYFWFRSNMLGYLQWFFFTLCPFVTMLILNSLILKVIASARRIQQRINQKNQRKKAKQRNMTIMLLSVSCVFILLTAPASTFMAFGHLFNNLHGPNSQSLWIMFSLIYYANTAANFLLYFLTADVFRQELRVMILSLPGCSKFLPACSKLFPKCCRNDGENSVPVATAAVGNNAGADGTGLLATAMVVQTQLTTSPLLEPTTPFNNEKSYRTPQT